MLQPLTDPDYLEQFLSKKGIVPARSAGQNFLICEEPLHAIISTLEDGARSVTELGAGLGPLTQALIGSGYTVRAIERDETLARILADGMGKAHPAQLEVVKGDLRKTRWEWESPWQLVGNIPYNLSGYIMRHLVALEPAPQQAVFMVQQEVGERLAAIPPDGTLLSLAVQLWGSVHHLLSVPRTCFLPSPAVDSVVVLLLPHRDPLPILEREQIMGVASVFFQQKRKQMGGVLKRAYAVSTEQANQILLGVGATAATRPQELSVTQWNALTQQLTPLR